MRLLLPIALLLAPATAGAIFGTSFKVVLRDQATGKPVDGAFVIAREWASVGKLHGTSEYCVRADITPVREASMTMDLPSAGSDTTTRARGIDAIAYGPGYCLARTESARDIASYKYLPVGQAPPKEIDTSAETRLQMRRGNQSAEERLVYLQEMMPLFTCSKERWSDRSAKSLALFREAVLSEARTVARTRYEQGLAQKLGLGPEAASFTRDFVVLPEDYRVMWTDRGIVTAAGRPQAMPGPAIPHAPGMPSRMGGSMLIQRPSAPPTLKIHCRHGDASKCDLDERDAEGMTAILGTVYYNQAPADNVKVLLDAGADPSIPARPYAPAPIEYAILQLLRTSPGESRDRLARIVDLLAASPRTTIVQWLKDDLAADPSTWIQVRHQPGFAALVERRETLAKLPARPEYRPGCERLVPDTYQHRTWEEFPRLRPPKTGP